MMASQVILLRELLIVFYGNELSIGVTLGCWLLWTGLGSIINSRYFKQKRTKIEILVIIQSFLLPLIVAGIRFLPAVLTGSVTRSVSPLVMLVTTFCILILPCFIFGALFVEFVKAFKKHPQKGVRAGKVYYWETIGSAAGGLGVTLFLIPVMDSVKLAVILGLFFLVCVLSMERTKKTGLLIAAVLLLFFYISPFSDYIKNKSHTWGWGKSSNIVKVKDTKYQRITVSEYQDAYNFYSNRLFMVTSPDEMSAEYMGFLPLVQHPKPENILLLGGSGEELGEILKHKNTKVVFLEVDPEIINTVKRYSYSGDYFDNPRVTTVNMDGRRYLKKTNQNFDCIIVNLPEPQTAEKNRYYTREFYKEVKDNLSEKGILFFGIKSSPNYISRTQKKLLGSIYYTLKHVFKDVIVLPGDTNYFISSDNRGFITSSYREITDRIKKRNLNPEYLKQYYLKYNFSQLRVDKLMEVIKEVTNIKVNTDFMPTTYIHSIVHRASKFKLNLVSIYENLKMWHILVFGLILFGIIGYISIKNPLLPIETSVAVTGFSELSYQVLVLLSFQVIYGYVYYKMGIIISMFMVGLIAGSRISTENVAKGRGDISNYRWIQLGIILYPMILPAIFLYFSSIGSGFIGENIVFPLLPVIAGVMGGYQFPLANKLVGVKNKSESETAGILYGSDLIGSFAGAILTSLILIPVMGIIYTCLFIGFCNFMVMLLLVKYKST